ncbi:Putative ribonuclease H protein At1g65750 [Linum grandiflorum]
MSQFRPISCCNFNYKIISKIMANRLKQWIPNIVSEMQAAFTGGRQIQDNIIIVHEVLHQFKLRKKGKKFDIMMKIDMRKAYDLVEWDCLDSLLTAYGFSRKWCLWIRECVSTVRFAVLFNGEPSHFFSPSRGIRQGDPLSPFLFILMTNALSFIIEKGISSHALKGIKLRPHCPTLSHCLFADDTVIFGSASVDEVDIIMGTLSEYGVLTGQEVNMQKSSMFFSANTPEELRNAIRGRANFESDICHSKYLGVPTEWGRSKRETFGYLLNTMHKQSQAWKSTLLSHAGKEVLIKAIVQAIPTYIMSLFLLPKLIVRRMDTLLRNFFWAGSTTKRSIHWCNGAKLCAPKSEGGLGFRDFGSFNKALLAKQGWRLINNLDALWARILKGLYFRNDSFLSAKKGRRGSWIWMSLCDSRETLNLGVIRIIGNGESTTISDPWIPGLPNFRIEGFDGDNRQVCDWLLPNRDGWNWNAIRDEVSVAEADAIQRIQIGPDDLEDRWMWKHEKTGRFSVRTAYHATHGKNNPSGNHRSQEDSVTWKWIWGLPLPRKIGFFLWRMMNRGLATKLQLSRRNCAPNSGCPLCAQVESIHHCLFNCPHSTLTWNLFPHIIPPSTNEPIFAWFSRFRVVGQREEAILTASVCWNIWKARNEAVFNNQRPHATQTAARSSKDVIEWRIAWGTTPMNARIPTLITRHAPLTPPSNPLREIHCDGSFLHDSQLAAYGFTVMDVHGTVYDGRVGPAYVSSPMAAETRAILEAIEYAKHHGGQSTIFSDCLTLVDILNDRTKPWPWDCYSLVALIQRTMPTNHGISIRYLPRNMNRRADWLVKSFIHGTLPSDWICRSNSVLNHL